MLWRIGMIWPFESKGAINLSLEILESIKNAELKACLINLVNVNKKSELNNVDLSSFFC